MAAGYKTARARFVDDKMLKLPYQLMGQVLQQKDQGVEDTYGELAAFDDMLKVKHLDKDSQIAKQVLDQYQEQGDELTKLVDSNPIEYQKQMRKIKDLSRKLQRDMSEGQLAAIEDRYNSDIEFVKQLDDAEVSDEYKKLKREEALRNLGDLEYDPNTGKYNKYKPGTITEDVNLNERFEEYIKGMDADVESVGYDQDSGTYELTTFDGKTTTITEDKIHNVLMQKLKSDPDAMNSLNDRYRLKMGGYEDLYDERGELRLIDEINRVKHRTANGGYRESSRFSYADNILGNAMGAIQQKYRKYDTEFDTGTKSKPGANARLAHDLEQLENSTSVMITDQVEVNNGINSVADLENREEIIERSKDNLIQSATERLSSLYGRELDDSEKQLLQQGEFDELFRGLEGDENYDPGTVQTLKSQFTSVMQQDAINEAYYREFTRNREPMVGPVGVGDGDTIEIDGKLYSRSEFDDFVAGEASRVIPVKSGFINTPQKQIKAIRGEVKGLVESGRAKFRVNDNTNVEDFMDLVDTGAVTMDVESIRTDDPEVEAKKQRYQELTSKEGELSPQESSEANSILIDLMFSKGATFDYVPSDEAANFSVEEESILPEMDYGQSDKLEFTAGVGMGGKKVKLNIVNVESDFVNDYEARNKEALVINKKSALYSGTSEVPIPIGIDSDNSTIFASDMHYNPNKLTVTYKEPDGSWNTVSIYSDKDDTASYVRERLFGLEPPRDE